MIDYRKLLFSYAYNILGSSEDAWDIVQDILLKLASMPRGQVRNERNYLIKSVINAAINLKHRNKRLVLGDVWLPEPVATESPDKHIQLKEILSYSVLVLLERLNAQERAVFILRESFDYTHSDISQTLNITVEHSRKLLSRAKQKLFNPPNNLTNTEYRGKNQKTNTLLDQYIEAISRRDMNQLEQLLADDIVFHADGGTKLKVVKSHCRGAVEVAALLSFIYDKFQQDYRVKTAEINHQPALLYYQNDQLRACQVFEISPWDGKIIQINSIVDPDKIKSIVGD